MQPSSRLTSFQSKKFSKNKIIKSYGYLFLSVLAGALLIFGLSQLSYLKSINIRDITFSGYHIADENIIKAIVLEHLRGSYFSLFSRANIFLYPKAQIANSLKALSPEASSIEIKSNDYDSINVNFIRKNPTALVCPSLPSLDDEMPTSFSNCYYADSSGILFEKYSVIDSKSYNLYYLPVLEEQGRDNQSLIGKNIASQVEFDSLQKFYQGLRNIGLEPKAFLIKPDGEYEVYARDLIVYVNSRSSLEQQFSNLASFWGHESTVSSKINPDSLQYIDVRFGSNVFYR